MKAFFLVSLFPSCQSRAYILNSTTPPRHSHVLYLCEEAACSWRQLNQQEKADITRHPFPFLCEDIVRGLLEGQRTGRETVDTLCVCFNTEEKVCLCVSHE